MRKAFWYGIVSSMFFAVTFVLNRSMDLNGGSWIWSASLRYLFTLPLLLPITLPKIKPVLKEIKQAPGPWLLWSVVGFGLFYAPLSFASAFGESWLVASCWQITIVAGVLLTPLFGQSIPLKSLGFSMVILLGVFLLQTRQAAGVGWKQALSCILPVLVAAFSYPLGNRKMMALCQGRLDTVQRVFGMTLCSIPFWLLLSIYGLITVGPPDSSQTIQSLVVALFSGVAATLLFFKATDLVRQNHKQLAAVEATQSGEVLFTLLGGIFFLKDAVPDPLGWAAIALVVAGMVLNSLYGSR